MAYGRGSPSAELLRFGFYDNRDNRNNGLILNSMLSVDNNKNNFYQPEGWLPLDPTFTFVALKAQKRVLVKQI